MDQEQLEVEKVLTPKEANGLRNGLAYDIIWTSDYDYTKDLDLINSKSSISIYVALRPPANDWWVLFNLPDVFASKTVHLHLRDYTTITGKAKYLYVHNNGFALADIRITGYSRIEADFIHLSSTVTGEVYSRDATVVMSTTGKSKNWKMSPDSVPFKVDGTTVTYDEANRKLNLESSLAGIFRPLTFNNSKVHIHQPTITQSISIRGNRTRSGGARMTFKDITDLNLVGNTYVPSPDFSKMPSTANPVVGGWCDFTASRSIQNPDGSRVYGMQWYTWSGGFQNTPSLSVPLSDGCHDYDARKGDWNVCGGGHVLHTRTVSSDGIILNRLVVVFDSPCNYASAYGTYIKNSDQSGCAYAADVTCLSGVGFVIGKCNNGSAPSQIVMGGSRNSMLGTILPVVIGSTTYLMFYAFYNYVCAYVLGPGSIEYHYPRFHDDLAPGDAAPTPQFVFTFDVVGDIEIFV